MVGLLEFSDKEDHLSNKKQSEELTELDTLSQFENILRDEYKATNKFPSNWKKFLLVEPGTEYEFIKEHFILKTVLDNFKWVNVVIAGGIFTTDSPKSDIDVYIYGLDEEKTFDRMEAIVNGILNIVHDKGFKKNYKEKYIPKFIRTENALTIIFDNKFRSIQISFLRPRDPLELLLTFDIAPCRICYDGKNTYMTKSYKYAIEKKLYLVDETTLSFANEALGSRIEKYEKRGFKHISKVGRIIATNVKSGYEEEIEIDEKKNKKKFMMRNARDKLLDAMKKNPKLICAAFSIRHTSTHLKYNGYGIEFNSPEFLWYYLNRPHRYHELLTDRDIKIAPFELEGHITFMSAFEYKARLNNKNPVLIEKSDDLPAREEDDEYDSDLEDFIAAAQLDDHESDDHDSDDSDVESKPTTNDVKYRTIKSVVDEKSGNMITYLEEYE